MLKKMVILLLIAGLLVAAPHAMLAAAFQLSPTAKTAMDKLAAGPDRALGGKITAAYNELLKLQEEAGRMDKDIGVLHLANAEAETLVRKLIKELNADKRSKLEAQVKLTQDKYEPLFLSYTALNKQIAAVRPLKSKSYNAMLRAQADIMQTAVQIARADIKTKQAALKALKDSNTQTAKKIRAILDEADPLRASIKAEKSALSAPRKLTTEFGKSLNQAIKKNDANSVLSSLNSLVTVARQISAQNRKILELEKKTSGIIAKAKTQIPK
ncbi:hypothetical protein [Paenibacillus nasutitermitis]|uniref:Uncharacterized protein n=1 Tax=Paenibacillus nasutitermitis TaxID=1652958 RepID=A0A916ZIF7_9BACL|nr:hypothetical protein [Paenibacillus nasutitermitis]GGD98115.1 hypothetical protein GCM10010911_66140 [Paenibacillus nasutitermitis]